MPFFPSSRFRRCGVVLLSAVFVFAAARPAAAIKIVAYNLLAYPNAAADRNPHYRAILADIQPDLVVACEIDDSTAADAFLANVLNIVNPGQWNEHDHFNNSGSLTESVLYYRNTLLEPSGVGADRSTFLSTLPRITPRWKLRPINFNAGSNSFYIYGCHLKAGPTGDDATQRANAANLIRANANNFPASTRFLICGDMNFYTSAELAYTHFTGSQGNNNGRVIDILNPNLVLQAWSDAPFYAGMHSQSPRTSNPPNQGGGTVGGLDDRFDFIFMSTVLNSSAGIHYIPGSYRTYGQDGQRFNNAVNDPPTNADVGQVLADSLWWASDHLPVLLELNAPAGISIGPLSLDFGTVIVGATATRTITVTNTAYVPGETLTYTYFGVAPMNFTAPAGLQSEPAGGGSNVDPIAMLTDTRGVKDQAVAFNVSTNVRETPSFFQVAATGTVLGHALPSATAGVQTLTADLDFGSHAVGEFSDQTAEVHNVDYDSLQALLNVYDHTIADSGHGRFSLVNAPPEDVGATPATFAVHFDDVGAAPGNYTATLEFLTRDQTGTDGGIDLPSVVYNLSANIPGGPIKGDFNDNGIVDCADVPPFIALLLDPDAASPEHRDIGDMNSDTSNDADDIQLFVDAVDCP